MQNILLIEDNPSDQFLAEEIIVEVFPDINIHISSDGEEALDYLGDNNANPEIILLDINMPRMNGHQFLTEYSKQCNGKVPIVIMLTSSSQENDKHSSMKYEFVRDYFVKPITRENVKRLSEIITEFSI